MSEHNGGLSRREFLKRLGILTAGVGVATHVSPLFAKRADRELFSPARNSTAERSRSTRGVRHTAATGQADLVGVRNARPEEMFDAGIAALGGMSRFVSRGQRVCIKPNVSWNIDPDRGATTDPRLVARIVEHCLEAGASRVYVVDHTIDTWHLAYKATGMEQYVKGAGARLVPGNSESLYQEVTVPGGRNLKSTQVHEVVLESDVLINVPILKDHGSTGITAALKNLMGLVWNRWYYHGHGLNQCIADFPRFRAPDLNVVDAHVVMTDGGPRGSGHRSNLVEKKMQILSPDIVAADTAAAQTFGTRPDRIRHIPLAEAHGLGTMDLDSLRVRRIDL